jgi:hypothetical protein
VQEKNWGGAMGIWDAVRRVMGREIEEAVRERVDEALPEPLRSKKKGKRRAKALPYAVLPEHLRGPAPETFLTADDIEQACGRGPVGEVDRKRGGSDNDIGYTQVCEWKLAGGGELLLNYTRIRDREAEELWWSRWNDPSWQVEDEKPLEGVGEVATWHLANDPKGGTELHVDAKEGVHKASIVYSDRGGSTDITPIVELMNKVLARLRE